MKPISSNPQHALSLRGIRQSKRRNTVEQVIAEAAGPMTVAEIVSAAQKSLPDIGVATVYRALKRLQENGTICAVILPSRETRYELADRHHHDYFHCSHCQRVYVFARRRVAPRSKTLPRGFRIQGHELTIYGLCPSCNADLRTQG